MSERFCGKTKAEIQRQVADINAKNREYWKEHNASYVPFSRIIEERKVVSRDLKKQIPSSGASNITIPPSNNTRVIVDPMSASARIVEFEIVYPNEDEAPCPLQQIKMDTPMKKEVKKKDVKKFIEGKTKRHIDF